MNGIEAVMVVTLNDSSENSQIASPVPACRSPWPPQTLTRRASPTGIDFVERACLPRLQVKKGHARPRASALAEGAAGGSASFRGIPELWELAVCL